MIPDMNESIFVLLLLVSNQEYRYVLQLSIHDYWKTYSLARQNFVSKVMSLLFNYAV